MTDCRRCGEAIRGNRRLCPSCSLDERHGNIAGDRDNDPDPHVFECCQCGTRYVFAGGGGCPECGAQHRRYAGEPDEYDGNLPRVMP